MPRDYITSCWLNQHNLKNMLVEMASSSPVTEVQLKKYLEPLDVHYINLISVHYFQLIVIYQIHFHVNPIEFR